MEGLQPTIDIGGNNGMGNWGGALIGGAIGGAVGSAWGRGGNWNNGNCCGGGCCGTNGNQYVMESLTTMRSDVDSIGRDQLMQVANLGSQLCEGFGRTISSVQNVAAQLAQGQSRTLLEPLTRASEQQDATEAQQKKLTPTPQPAGQPGSDTKA